MVTHRLEISRDVVVRREHGAVSCTGSRRWGKPTRPPARRPQARKGGDGLADEVLVTPTRRSDDAQRDAHVHQHFNMGAV